MKLSFFALDLSYKRGVNKLSVNLIEHLAQNRDVDEILAICDYVEEDVYKSLRHKKISLQCTGPVKRSDFLRIFIRNIRYLHRSHELKKYDIFHVVDDRALPFILPNVHPLILTIHNIMLPEFLSVLKEIRLEGIVGLLEATDLHLPQIFLEFLSAKKAKGIVVSSPPIAHRLRRLYGNDLAGKIRIIPPGFDPEKFNPYSMSKSDAKKLLHLDPSSTILLHIGGSLERKGLPYLLYALEYMHTRGKLEWSNLYLLVLGKLEGKWPHPTSQIRKHIVELPYVPEGHLPNVYRASDVCVMPSISEGWGMALIEALACGTPVVASAVVPSALALQDLDVVRIEYEVDNPIRLARSILNVLENDYPRNKDWDRIFTLLSLLYSWENYAKHHAEIYKEFLQEDS